MFANPKVSSTKNVKKPDVSLNSVTILTRGCHFHGKLYCKGATRVGGEIDGEIISEGVLIIEQSAKIKAQILADEVIIYGVFEGNLKARVRVELCQSAQVFGDIDCSVLSIKEGAVFCGKSLMSEHLRARETLVGAVAFDGHGQDEALSPKYEKNQKELSMM